MNAILGKIDIWQVVVAIVGVIAFLALTFLRRFAKAPRLIVRAAIHKNKTTILRILMHNAEQSMTIHGLSIVVTLQDRVVRPPLVRGFAWPKFEGHLSLEPQSGGVQLLFRTETKLPPGRSWMMQMEFLDNVTGAVDCSVEPLVDVEGETLPRSRPLTVRPISVSKTEIDQRDTLHTVFFPVLAFVLALCIGAIVLVVLLVQAGLFNQMGLGALGALCVLVAIASVLLHRLLRPIAPYVALGYRDGCNLTVDVPGQAAAPPADSPSAPQKAA